MDVGIPNYGAGGRWGRKAAQHGTVSVERGARKDAAGAAKEVERVTGPGVGVGWSGNPPRVVIVTAAAPSVAAVLVLTVVVGSRLAVRLWLSKGCRCQCQFQPQAPRSQR